MILYPSFDTKNGNRVYIGEKPGVLRKIFSLILVLLIGTLYIQTVRFAAKMIELIPSTVLQVIVMIIAVLLAFLLTVIILALTVHFIRYKVFKTYGYLTIEKEDLCFYFTDKNRSKINFELKLLEVISTTRGKERTIEFGSQGKTIDLGHTFTSTYALFVPYVRQNKGKYPTDVVFAAWLNAKLTRNNELVKYSKSQFLF